MEPREWSASEDEDRENRRELHRQILSATIPSDHRWTNHRRRDPRFREIDDRVADYYLEKGEDEVGKGLPFLTLELHRATEGSPSTGGFVDV